MPLGYKIIRRKHSAMKQKDIYKELRLSMERIGQDWWSTAHTFKFTPAAARRYNYAERFTKRVRTGRIRLDNRGRPRAPSGNPLEWSGISKALAKSRKIRATRHRARVTVPIRIFNRVTRGRHPKNPKLDLPSEWKAVTQTELRGLSFREQKRLQARLRGHAGVQVIRIGSFG